MYTYLERVVESVRVYLSECRLVGVRNKFLDLGEDVPVEVKVEFWLLRADNFRKVLPAQLVSIFKFSVVIGLLLNCVVSQMHGYIRNIVQ